MNDEMRMELEALLRRSGEEALSPKQVYEYALANKKTAVGKWFEAKGAFDPKKAVRNWGIACGRRLLKIVTIVVTPSEAAPVRVSAFISIPSKRGDGKPSYYPAAAVAASEVLAQEAVAAALKELAVVRAKYSRVKELASVWESIEKAKMAVA